MQLGFPIFISEYLLFFCSEQTHFSLQNGAKEYVTSRQNNVANGDLTV